MRPLPAYVVEELRKTGLDWSVKRGAKHYLIKCGTHLLALMPHRCHDRDRNAANMITAIRRNARVIREGGFVKAR